jgi:flagellar biosynthesis/type III secretory pathway chaperone
MNNTSMIQESKKLLSNFEQHLTKLESILENEYQLLTHRRFKQLSEVTSVKYQALLELEKTSLSLASLWELKNFSTESITKHLKSLGHDGIKLFKQWQKSQATLKLLNNKNLINGKLIAVSKKSNKKLFDIFFPGSQESTYTDKGQMQK